MIRVHRMIIYDDLFEYVIVMVYAMMMISYIIIRSIYIAHFKILYGVCFSLSIWRL